MLGKSNVHMRQLLLQWWAGLNIFLPGVILATLPISLVRYKPAVLAGGSGPMWWRVTSVVVMLIVFVGIPLRGLQWAKRILRNFEKGKAEIFSDPTDL
jgi:hypothetical protein